LTCAGLLVVGVMPAASAQTPTPKPTGEFLCTVAGGASPDGKACNGDDDCAPNGVCVIAQPVCNGGTDDGAYCGCIGTQCTATSPACDSADALPGVCPSGPNATECCDPATNCSDGAPCIGAQKVCLGGDNKAVSCLNDGQCPGSVCRSTGKFCNGGDLDSFSCVDDSDCVGTSSSGTCDSVAVSTPVPTVTKVPTSPVATRTPTQTHGAGTVVPTGTRTPTGPRPTGTVKATATATPTQPVGSVANLAQAVGAAPTDSIVVEGSNSLPTSGGTIQIDNELIAYRAVYHNTQTGFDVLTGVTRGADGTTPAAHARGSAVFLIEEAATPTPRVSATPANNSGFVEATGNGGGCSLAGGGRTVSGGWILGVALAVSVLRRRRETPRDTLRPSA